MLIHLLALSSIASAATLSVGPGETYTSIQDAIDDASGGDIVEVAIGSYSENINYLGKEITVRGVSSTATILNPATSGLAVVIFDSGETSATLENVGIEPASGERGIYMSSASPTISNVRIEGAGDWDTMWGGGIYVEGGAPTFEDMMFIDNEGAKGGDVYATTAAAITIRACEFEDSAGKYGATFFVQDSLIDISDSTSENATSQYSGAFAYLDGSTFTASNVDVNSPLADQAFGTGVYATGRSNIVWSGGEIVDALATSFASGYSGGAMYLEDSSTLAATDMTLDSNTAYNGGAIELQDGSTGTFVNCTFENNLAHRAGGALRVYDSAEATCSGCSFDSNEADRGGAVDISVDASFIDTDGNYLDNEANTQDGGAIRVTVDGEFTATESTFNRNEAANAGGALYLYSPGDTVSVNDCGFTNNTAGTGDGGAILVDLDAELEVSGGHFDDNTAELGAGGAIAFDPVSSGFALTIAGAVFEGNQAESNGGALYTDDAESVTITDVVFLRNRAPNGSGGAVFFNGDTDHLVQRVLFHANSALDGGGGIFEEETSGDSLIENCVFTENSGGTGGAIHLNDVDTQVELVNITFAGNEGSSAGAHLYLDDSTVSFVNNIAWSGQDGGGLYAADGPSATGSDFYYSDVGNNSGGDYTGSLTDPTGASGNINEEPAFRDYSIDADEDNDNLYLQIDSPCVNTGDPSIVDVDGTRADMGAYGGPNADADDGDGDGHYDITDCNDADASIHPGAVESPYDGVDQDCDGSDLNDVDGDGFDASEVGGTDCDDAEALVFPGATEIWYDGIDQDCDTESDYDADLDGYDWDVYDGLDCDDTDPAILPGASDSVGDGIDQNCDGVDGTDADGDGYASIGTGGEDCDDTDALVHPDASEIPYDGIDQDCDGDDLHDVDGDGFDSDLVAGGTDCDDTDASVFPGGEETWYDGVDGDCNGLSDYDADLDGYDVVAFGGTDCDDTNPLVNPGSGEIWYDGVDSDCDGRSDYDQDMDGRDSMAYDGDDCDDEDDTIYPGADDVPYDGIDQDCNGVDLKDVDGDGYDGGEFGPDCDDSNPTIYPGVEDLWYDGIDHNCDGVCDYDQDGDGCPNGDFYDAAAASDDCDTTCFGDGGGSSGDDTGADTGEPTGPLLGDCDDHDPEIRPGIAEVYYDGVDQNCDGLSDYDADLDGFDTDDHLGDDCDDDDDTIFPGAEELLDSKDNDCDGYTEMDDRDGDGVADWYEWQLGTDYENEDSDGDGWFDGFEVEDPENPRDMDGDGTIDALDSDDDGDRIPTLREQTEDVDDDGVADTDLDGDGILNGRDLDSDADGYSDKEEGALDRDGDGIPDYLDYQGGFLGGGCTGCSGTGGGGNGAPLWMSILVLAVALRRRSQWIKAPVVAALVVSGTAVAQDVQLNQLDARGFWVADTAGDNTRSIRLVYPANGDGWDAGMVVDLARNPLREYQIDESIVVVDTMVTTHVYGAWDMEQFRFDMSYPFTAYGHDQIGGFAASGDVRLGALWAAMPPDRGHPGVGAQLLTWLPTGTRSRWSGSPGPSVGAIVAAAQEFGPVGYTLNAGVRMGTNDSARNLATGSSPIGGFEMHYKLPVLDEQLAVGGEVAIQGATGFQSWPVEPGVRVRWRQPEGTFAVLGGSMGVGEGAGAAQWRAYLGLGYGGIPPETAPEESTIVVPVILERIERASKEGPLAQLVDDRIIVREQVFFREARAEIVTASEPVLHAVKNVLVDHPAIQHLLIGGHTNSRGSRAYNRKLSKARAEAVMAWLEVNGIDGDRLLAKGFGEDKPLKPDKHPDAMIVNRRVEFTVLRSDESEESPTAPELNNLPQEVQDHR